MIWLVVAAILALIGLGIAIKGKINDEYTRKPGWMHDFRWTGLVVLFISMIVVLVDSFTIIPTRNIGVQTSFGKPIDTLSNGWHWVRPWSDIHTFDATIQTLKLSGEKFDAGDPITVRLANAATATVEVTVQWQVDPDADITQLYLDYKEFEKIETNVVRRQLAAAMNAAFEKYDPLVALKPDASRVEGKTLADLGKDVQESLVAGLPAGIKVRSVLIPRIVFDDSIQGKINQYLAALAETQIAEQRKQTAAAQKAANDLLAKADSTPAVLYQNCLDMVERLTRDGKTLPAAFSCGLPPQTVIPVK